MKKVWVENSFDRIADVYDDTRRMPPEAVAQIMEDITNEMDPSDGLVLEMGIGTGRIAVPLSEKGFRIVGVDIAEKMLANLQNKLTATPHGIHAVRGNVAALPFTGASFCSVIAVHVFHLLNDIPRCISEARRVLLRGGCLLFGGEQRLLRSVQQILAEKYSIEENFVDALTEAGIKLPDQNEIERQVIDVVGDMGGTTGQLAPVEWDYEITIADIIGRIGGRIASYLWDVPEESMRNLVERLREALETNVGPPSTVIRFHRRFTMYCSRFS